MIRPTDPPNAAERRLLEETFDAFQYDPLRDRTDSAKRNLALGAAAIILRDTYKIVPAGIAALLQVHRSDVMGLILYARHVLDTTTAMAVIFDDVRARNQPPEQKKRGRKPKEKGANVIDLPTQQLRTQLKHLTHVIAVELCVDSEVMQNHETGSASANARTIAMACAVALHKDRKPAAIGQYFDRLAADVIFASRRVSTALQRQSGSALCRDAIRVCRLLGMEPSSLILKK